MASYPNNIIEITTKLKDSYKDFAHFNKKRPLDELLFIICSVKTTQMSYHKTYLELKRAFPRYSMIQEATQEQISAVIYNGGLSNQKAKSIKQIFDAINKKFNKITLSPIKLMSDEDCENFLTSLPGIGIKVARCIMLYSLGRQVFPVDTNCWRICRRLGWISSTKVANKCSNKDMDTLQEKIPPNLRFSFHVNLVSLGRKVCTPKKPNCSICPIGEHCSKIGL